ncbi:hypothetical protein ARMGADRAFT_1040565 [Armillaria gallica]|uniref:Uncharacterized protein n=1 Tax=Armillaria gallica TaxID=47427 RepID=A0A2H3CD21_ARMGA|nr:hypothetical protein ARMGADRAFT_1040565 [Armillaria gallica]
MVLSASAQRQATGGKYQKTIVTHVNSTMENVIDYTKVEGIVIGCLVVFLVALLGPEKYMLHLEKHNTVFIIRVKMVQHSSWTRDSAINRGKGITPEERVG